MEVWPTGIGADYHNGLRDALRAYCRWLDADDAAVQAVPKARKRRRLPRPYADAQRVCYLRAASDLGARYNALACLGVYAGLRLREAVSLQWVDIGPRIRVNRGKGGKDREVPTAAALRDVLEKWRTECT